MAQTRVILTMSATRLSAMLRSCVSSVSYCLIAISLLQGSKKVEMWGDAQDAPKLQMAAVLSGDEAFILLILMPVYH